MRTEWVRKERRTVIERSVWKIDNFRNAKVWPLSVLRISYMINYTNTRITRISFLTCNCLDSWIDILKFREFSKTLVYNFHTQLMGHWPTLASFRSSAWVSNPTKKKIPFICFPTTSWCFKVQDLYATCPNFPLLHPNTLISTADKNLK